MNRPRKLDKTYSDTWKNRSLFLSGFSYEEYLKSDHWLSVRKKAHGRKAYQKCKFCSCTKIDLHHTTYKWIFTKFELRAIIPLCREHHEEVHEYAKKHKYSVRVATNKINHIHIKYDLKGTIIKPVTW